MYVSLTLTGPNTTNVYELESNCLSQQLNVTLTPAVSATTTVREFDSNCAHHN